MSASEDVLGAWRSPIPMTGMLATDVRAYLASLGCALTADHSGAVAEEARLLALRFGVDADRAGAAGWLHDVSAVIPRSQRVAVALDLGLPLLSEEHRAPVILHQKLAAVLAQKLFQIDDRGILDAICYHTTLHPTADLLARVVFLADKIRWDQVGEPPYLARLRQVLETGSLDAACCVYLDFLWERRETLPVVHPWMVAARHRLCVSGGCL